MKPTQRSFLALHVHSPRIALLGVLMLQGVGCAGVDAAPARAEAKPAEAPIAVKVSRSQRGALARVIRGTGTLHTKAESDLSFKIGGVIQRVAVDVGDRVRKGQVLAVVDATEARSALSQAHESKAKAERDLERVRTLHGSGAAVRADLQNAETALAVTSAALTAAEFNLRHTTIVAPVDGVIDQRSCEVGEIAAPGRPMFHMSSASRGIVVRSALTDRDALRVRLGDRAQVTLDAQPERPYAAHVTQIATQATAGAGTIDVEVSLDDAVASSLPAGLSAKVAIDERASTIVSVPITALVEGDGDAAALFVVNGDRVRHVPVRVAFLTGDRAALAAGLDAGELVVDVGADQLSDGALIAAVR